MNNADIIILLDKSGSMESIKASTIEGFNGFLETLEESDKDSRITLMQFNHRYEQVFEGKKISEVEKLTPETYLPDGLTALLDAMGTAIRLTRKRLKEYQKEDRPDKVLFIIITDGLENCSTEFKRQEIFKTITRLEEKQAWEFIYLGANQDAIQVADHYGIRAKRAMTFAADTLGTLAIYETLSSNIHHCLSRNAGFEFSTKQRINSQNKQ